MRSTVGIGHASAALQRLLDPLHPDPMGEAKRQIRHLTATELQETMTALLVLHRIAQEVERIAPTGIDIPADHLERLRFANDPRNNIGSWTPMKASTKRKR